MATSSITHNCVINTPEGVENFLRALDIAEKNYRPTPGPNGKELTKSEELNRFIKRLKETYGF